MLRERTTDVGPHRDFRAKRRRDFVLRHTNGSISMPLLSINGYASRYGFKADVR
jgi:hypothetical protein